MKIRELFVKPVDRLHRGVIKADDDGNIQTEVEEYVVTGEVAKGLGEFVDRYLDETSSNGVWISGFFGSGKSHLLKILSLVLENKELPNGARATDVLLPKIDDEFLKADLQKARQDPVAQRPVQHRPEVGRDRWRPRGGGARGLRQGAQRTAGLLREAGTHRPVRIRPRSRGQLEGFKEAYAAVSGSTWEKDLPVLETLENEMFAKAYSSSSAGPTTKRSSSSTASVRATGSPRRTSPSGSRRTSTSKAPSSA